MSHVSVFHNSFHVFNFDCGFTHVSYIWPDRKFQDELIGSCCKVIETTTIKLSTILQRYVKDLCVSLPKELFSMASFGLII